MTFGLLLCAAGRLRLLRNGQLPLPQQLHGRCPAGMAHARRMRAPGQPEAVQLSAPSGMSLPRHEDDEGLQTSAQPCAGVERLAEEAPGEAAWAVLARTTSSCDR